MTKTALTSAQRRLLQRCEDEGSIEIGGESHTRGARRDVVARLAQLRLIEWRCPSSLRIESEWRITTAGRAALARVGGEA